MSARAVSLLRRDRGSVTAEFALVLPAVVAVLVVVLTTASAAIAQVRCADAARAGARAAAVGEPHERVRAAAVHLAGPGASIEVSRDGPWAVVRVDTPVQGPFPGLRAGARAEAWVEPGVAW